VIDLVEPDGSEDSSEYAFVPLVANAIVNYVFFLNFKINFIDIMALH
jgi:hypothetical protein